MQRQFVGSERSAAMHKAAYDRIAHDRTALGQPSRRAVVATIVGGGTGFPHLHQRHREQVERRGQTKSARPLGGTRQIARQLLELVSP